MQHAILIIIVNTSLALAEHIVFGMRYSAIFFVLGGCLADGMNTFAAHGLVADSDNKRQRDLMVADVARPSYGSLVLRS